MPFLVKKTLTDKDFFYSGTSDQKTGVHLKTLGDGLGASMICPLSDRGFGLRQSKYVICITEKHDRIH
jgi:hypothetical protein